MPPRMHADEGRITECGGYVRVDFESCNVAEAQRHLRAAGFNAWVFATEIEAVHWLQGRSLGGRTAS